MAKITDDAKVHSLTVYLPDTRGTVVSPFGRGNLKIGLGVYTYSRLPGLPENFALGMSATQKAQAHNTAQEREHVGTCPGATKECQDICYAARPVTENGPVYEMWVRNSQTEDVPLSLPPDCTLLRLHISGDFTTAGYINGWYALLTENPQVKVWAYTRSWRVKALRPYLERLRRLSNVQLFASVDRSTPGGEIAEITAPHSDNPWRLAWIDGDIRGELRTMDDWRETSFGGRSLVCPEETGKQPNCQQCRYCFDGQRFDVTFLRH